MAGVRDWKKTRRGVGVMVGRTTMGESEEEK